MKNVANTVVTIILTFVVTLILQFAVEFFVQKKGEVKIGPLYSIQGQTYVPVDISNFAQEQLNVLLLSIPVSTDIGSIVSSGPVQVEEIHNTVRAGNRKRLKLSGMEASQVTRFLIPVANQNEAEFVQVTNARELKLSVSPIKDIEHPIKTAVINASINASILALFYAVIMLWIGGLLTDAKEKLEQAKKESAERSEKLKNDIDEQREKTNQELSGLKSKSEEAFSNMRKDWIRQRVLLFARLSDYAKELDFWRDTVRKVLYTADAKSVSESLITQVTESLKTYTTRGKAADDFETIKALAGILADSKPQTK